MKNKVVQGAHVTLRNNCVAFIFDEIRYELGVEIDGNRNVCIIRTFKNYVTVSSDRNVILRNGGWDTQNIAAGYFNFYLSLYVVLGFCKNYKRSSRVDFNTSAQRQQLFNGKSGDRANA